MRSYRTLLSFVLALLAFVLVSCGGPNSTTVVAPTYTPAQLEKIQSYLPKILANHQRLGDLKTEIQTADWQEAQALMRGPLGQMLQDMHNLSRNLSPQDQQAANQVVRDLFEDLTAIDQAAQLDKVSNALSHYEDALQDFERFIQLIPAT